MVKEELTKQVEEISMERNIANLKRERDQYIENLARLSDDFERLENEKKSLEKRYEVMLKPENFKIIRPIWQYETDPEYIDTLKIEYENKRRHDFHLIDQNRTQMEKFKKAQEEALESVSSELERLEKGE